MIFYTPEKFYTVPLPLSLLLRVPFLSYNAFLEYETKA